MEESINKQLSRLLGEIKKGHAKALGGTATAGVPTEQGNKRFLFAGSRSGRHFRRYLFKDCIGDTYV